MAIPSPYADHDHVRAKALSGQREQVRDDKKEMPSPYADYAHISASRIQGECRDRLLADCHD